MARLFALIGNRADLVGRVLAAEADALRVRAPRVPPRVLGGGGGESRGEGAEGAGREGRGSPLGWGLGFYQGDEVLMRRRPIDDKDEIDLAKNAADVRADVLIGHVRSATVGSLRTENTHPFRYRNWLFAQTGTVANFDALRERLLASVPEFLRGDIRGETDSEIVFHVFLSFLHDGGKLQKIGVEAEAIRDALRSTMAVVDGMTAEVGGTAAPTNMLVTNGDHVVVVHRGGPMAIRTFAGRAEADALIGDDLALRRKSPELAHMHFDLLASDFDGPAPGGRWKPVADRAIVALTRGHDPKVTPL